MIAPSVMNLTAVPAFSDNYIWMIDDGRNAIVVDPGEAGPVEAALDAKRLALAATRAERGGEKGAETQPARRRSGHRSAVKRCGPAGSLGRAVIGTRFSRCGSRRALR